MDTEQPLHTLPPLEVIGERIMPIEKTLEEAIANGQMTPEEAKECLEHYVIAFFGEDVP